MSSTWCLKCNLLMSCENTRLQNIRPNPFLMSLTRSIYYQSLPTYLCELAISWLQYRNHLNYNVVLFFHMRVYYKEPYILRDLFLELKGTMTSQKPIVCFTTCVIIVPSNSNYLSCRYTLITSVGVLFYNIFWEFSKIQGKFHSLNISHKIVKLMHFSQRVKNSCNWSLIAPKIIIWINVSLKKLALIIRSYADIAMRQQNWN